MEEKGGGRSLHVEEVFSLEEPLGCADFAAMYIAFLHIWASTILVVGVLMINC